MPTIDLPAHNVTMAAPSEFPATLVGDGEALATTDTSTYVEMLWTGGQNFQVGTGTPGTGFGLATVPVGATVTGVQMVALAYRSGGGANVPTPGWEEPVSEYPSIAYQYINDPWPGNYNIGPLTTGTYTEAFSTIPADQWKYVIDGLEPGFAGLSPNFFVGPSDSGPFPRPALTVRVAYLALRVTYSDAAVPVLAARATRVTPSLRMLQRGGAGGMSGIPRMIGNPVRRGSLRQGPGSVY